MIRETIKNQRALVLTGFAHLLLFVVLGVAAQFDSQQILGIDRWIKPMKFAVSITIYVWTLAVFLNFVRGYERTKNLIVGGTIVFMVGEMIFITMQSWRGTTSHFNTATAFDAVVFITMGIMIMLSTVLAGVLLFVYFKAEIDLPRAVIWGVRLGIILLVAASIEGGAMASYLRHTVGAADGGAGLPFVNWSTVAGDLRVAHFIGLHAFQAVPLVAYTLERWRPQSAVAGTFVFAALYYAVFTGVLIQAMLGKPLFAGF